MSWKPWHLMTEAERDAFAISHPPGAQLDDDVDDPGWVATDYGGDEAAALIAESICEGSVSEGYAVHLTHPDVARRVAQSLRDAGHLSPVATTS